MRPLRLLLVLSLVAGQASADAPPVTAPIPEIMKELRKIEGAAYRLGATDSLRVDYTALLRQRPGDYMLRVYVAWCGLPSEDTWNQLKGVVAVNPDLAWLHYGMGRIYVIWKMRDQAKTEFELILKREPKFYPAITGLGDVARGQKDWPKAEQQYRAALALAADDPMARTGLGLTLLELGKPGDAAVELKASVGAWAEQPVALDALVKLLVDAKDPAAADAASKLADLQPRNREVRKLLGNLRFEAGEKKEAAKEYERLLRLGNPELEIVQRLAVIYHDDGDVEGEERSLTLVTSLDKTNADAPMRLAEIFLARNDLEGSRGQVLEALARDPKRAEAQLRLAKLAVQAGTLYEALEHYRAAGQLGSDEAKVAAAKLEGDFKLGKVKPKGSVDQINASLAGSLDKFFMERLAAKPALAGTIKIRVRVDKDGVVLGVDLLDDTVGDPYLAGHVYTRLRDASFPKQKREPVFEFELGKKK